MSLRQKIRVTMAIFAASIVLMAAGIALNSVAMSSGGALIFLAAVITALFWWRCPHCGKGFDPPFPNGKKCRRCGREIDYEARKRYF